MTSRDWNAVRYDPSRRGGHVESYFFKLNDPEGRRALWLKATILASLSRAPVAEAWAIAFDREGEHVGVKEVVPYSSASFSPERFDVSVAGIHFTAGRIAGSIESGGHQIEYSLDFDPSGPPLVHYPKLGMYDAPVPKSKLVTPYPDTRFTGHYHVDGQEVKVDGWRGMQGHNWQKEHAKLYAWGHCNQWEEDPDVMFEGASAKIKMGPITTPLFTGLFLWRRGVRYEFADLSSWLVKNQGSIEPRRWHFQGKSELASIEGELYAETEDFAGLYYESPDGEMSYCLNSKIAHGRLRLDILGRGPLELTTRSAALEITTKDPRHGVRMLA